MPPTITALPARRAHRTSALHRHARRLVTLLLALAVAVVTLWGNTPGTATAAAGLSVTIRNTTGSSQPVYVYVLGTRLTDHVSGYVTAGGAFRAWPAVSGSATRAAPDVAIRGPRNGAATTVRLPHGISGRLYYSVGAKLDLRLVRDGTGRTGLVQPAPWVAGDASASTLFDWVEFTYQRGLWVNSTQVDQFALPAALTLRGAKGTRSTGRLVSDGRQRVARALLADPALRGSVITDRSGRLIRVLAPGHAAREGRASAGYLNRAIDRAWARYATRTLTVRPFADRPSRTYHGRTVGSTLVFRSKAGAVVAKFAKPSTLDVFECAGTLAAPNDRVVGPIARTLCAALNRGTLAGHATQPVTATGSFYRTGPFNAYAKAVHAVMVDKRAYAFAFDDVAQHEPLLHDAKPRSLTITLPHL